ncbi:MAG: hypothetical protein H6Q23_986, partial [Bacteroidetes bacterium]|nr:hypothetical protein [Bacteroidota bacterium]
LQIARVPSRVGGIINATTPEGWPSNCHRINWKSTHSGVGEMLWYYVAGVRPGLLGDDTAGVDWK